MSVDVDVRDGVAEVVVCREPSLNALDSAVLKTFKKLWPELDDREDVRCIILRGSGDKAFSVGSDLKEAPDGRSPIADVFGATPRGRPIHRVTERTPVVAAISGYCLGGGFELALACDIRIASTGATFGLPELKVGSYPGAGGVQRIASLLPRSVAIDLVLTGERLSAERAYHFGLVSRLTTPGALLLQARDVAKTIAAAPPISVRAVKRSLSIGVDRGLHDLMALEEVMYGLVAHSDDRAEGRAAFQEKREPEFRGT